MKKIEIIKLINDATDDVKLKEMVVGYIETAYDAGFQEGMIRASQIQSQTFDMLFNKKPTI